MPKCLWCRKNTSSKFCCERCRELYILRNTDLKIDVYEFITAKASKNMDPESIFNNLEFLFELTKKPEN